MVHTVPHAPQLFTSIGTQTPLHRRVPAAHIGVTVPPAPAVLPPAPEVPPLVEPPETVEPPEGNPPVFQVLPALSSPPHAPRPKAIAPKSVCFSNRAMFCYSSLRNRLWPALCSSSVCGRPEDAPESWRAGAMTTCSLHRAAVAACSRSVSHLDRGPSRKVGSERPATTERPRWKIRL